MDMAVIELSRLQFALTALYHFLFVPLTLGLSFLLVIMESLYVMTDRPEQGDQTAPDHRMVVRDEDPDRHGFHG